MNENWEIVKTWAAFALPWLLGGGAVWIIQQIKNTLKLAGWHALVATALVSVVLASVSSIAGGLLTPENFATPALFSQSLIAIVVASQIIYRQFAAQGAARKPDETSTNIPALDKPIDKK